ncbi:hypothetical protein ACIA58_31620 [Kribbella sp. NPDC051586]|uniref:hypothetical protein n=1 Tax=Kribbella sp. NPDC051586 TaxID=3364118 RepID=UPI00378B566F
MSDLEKGRVQRDARRTVASRRSRGSTNPEQAILSHLGIELYKEHHRAEHPPEKASATDNGPTTNPPIGDFSPDRGASDD